METWIKERFSLFFIIYFVGRRFVCACLAFDFSEFHTEFFHMSVYVHKNEYILIWNIITFIIDAVSNTHSMLLLLILLLLPLCDYIHLNFVRLFFSWLFTIHNNKYDASLYIINADLLNIRNNYYFCTYCVWVWVCVRAPLLLLFLPYGKWKL